MSNDSFIKKEILNIVMLLLPFFLIAYFWEQIPDQIAVHLNMRGDLDNNSSKEFGMFILPVINFFMYGMFLLLPRNDPKKENINFFNRGYKILRTSITALILIIFCAILYFALQ
ncbi:MAG: DUF1648 domain-containing protein [Candidatus Kapabacteria bacterium]|jgi:uncharacterized membrane protein|nr:DUF1648 domain-containing protein [Candidatus Kapabacteria bacterium]